MNSNIMLVCFTNKFTLFCGFQVVPYSDSKVRFFMSNLQRFPMHVFVYGNCSTGPECMALPLAVAFHPIFKSSPYMVRRIVTSSDPFGAPLVIGTNRKFVN